MLKQCSYSSYITLVMNILSKEFCLVYLDSKSVEGPMAFPQQLHVVHSLVFATLMFNVV